MGGGPAEGGWAVVFLTRNVAAAAICLRSNRASVPYLRTVEGQRGGVSCRHGDALEAQLMLAYFREVTDLF